MNYDDTLVEVIDTVEAMMEHQEYLSLVKLRQIIQAELPLTLPTPTRPRATTREHCIKISAIALYMADILDPRK